jgi:phosphatidylglycerophosphatase A
VAAHKIAPPKLTSIHDYVATFGGVGLLPIMPGSYCSLLVALPAAYGSLYAMWPTATMQLWYGIGFVVFTLLGTLSVKHVQKNWGHDPSVVVIDEAAGMCLTLMFPMAYNGLALWATAVLLFRVFDVMKPWPMNIINDRTEAWAVMGDDLAAGLVAGFSTQLVGAALLALGISLAM